MGDKVKERCGATLSRLPEHQRGHTTHFSCWTTCISISQLCQPSLMNRSRGLVCGVIVLYSLWPPPRSKAQQVSASWVMKSPGWTGLAVGDHARAFPVLQNVTGVSRPSGSRRNPLLPSEHFLLPRTAGSENGFVFSHLRLFVCLFVKATGSSLDGPTS